MQTQTYEVSKSKFIRGVAIVQPGDGSPTSPIAKLCEAFSGGRYSYREQGYRLNAVALEHFMTAARLGCTSPDGARVQWESPSRERFYSFSPAHPRNFLKRIAREA